MEEKKYLYLDKRVADRIENLSSVEHQLEVMDKILEERKKDIRLDMENLDDDMLQFKAFAVKYRKELEEVYKDQQDKAYKLWEKYNEELPRVREALKPVIDEVNKLTDIVDALNKKLTAISSWEVKELSTLLDILQHLSTKNASQIRKVVSVLAEKEM